MTRERAIDRPSQSTESTNSVPPVLESPGASSINPSAAGSHSSNFGPIVCVTSSIDIRTRKRRMIRVECTKAICGATRDPPALGNRTRQPKSAVEVKGLEPSAYGLQSRRSSS